MLFGFWAGLRYVAQFRPLYKQVKRIARAHPEIWQNLRAQYSAEKQAALVAVAAVQAEDSDVSTRVLRRKQIHLLRDRYSKAFVDALPELHPDTRQQVHCLREEFIHFINPSHYILTKKEKAALVQPLRYRWKHFCQDWTRWRGYFNLIKSDHQHFVLGKNLATTVGKVVAQNQILQLLHYAPKQDVVYANPVLISSSFINKYYMFDLEEKQSAIAWLIERGYQVYVISWVNADSQIRDFSVHDYLEQGTAWAMQQIFALHQKPVHLFGYCLGGMLNALARAWLHAQGCHYVASETYLASRFDYTQANRLNQLLCDRQGVELFSYFCQRMQKNGFWEGRQISTIFNFVNTKEYFWSLWRTRYIQAKPQFASSLNYWLQDVVNVPAHLAKFYLFDLLRDNRFMNQGDLEYQNISLSFSDSQLPTFFIGLKEDQLSLWQQVFTSSQLFLPQVEFLLAKGDHVSGVVSPLQRKHYGYWEHAKPLSLNDTPESWLEQATYVSSSFWLRWEQWLQQHSIEKVAPLYNDWPELESAPGSYVKKSVWD